VRLVKEFTSVAEGLVAILLVLEAALLARVLAVRGRPLSAPWRRAPLVLAVAFAGVALVVARGGALAPGISGAGMPWEDVTDATDAATSARAGERAYLNRCAPCHLPDGRGLPPAYPPLAGSAVVAGPVDEHVRVALWGSRGVRVPRSGAARMPAFAGVLSDAELAAILTYERSAWGHDAGIVRPSDVARGRARGREEGLAAP
jgi:mono/diheme cytochrome c family protein